MTRTAIYCRISKDREGEGLGVERQREDCLALAARRGWEVVEVFTDNDVSASTASKKPRPSYAAMLAAVEAGQIDAVVSYSNSRLTRRPAEWLTLIALARAGQLEIATVASGAQDLGTADGRAIALTVAAWDAAEAERTSERQARQFAQRAASGKPQGGRFRTYGFTRDWEVIPEEAEHVVWAFEQRVAGVSLNAISNGLNERGSTTSTGRAWDSGNVRKMLARAQYAGLRTHRGEVVSRSLTEAIVTEDLWRRANGQGVRLGPGHNTRRHLLSGLLTCSHCSTGLVGSATRDVYRCPTTRGCGRTVIRKAAAEDPIISLIVAREATRKPASAPAGPALDLGPIDAEIEAAQALYASGDLALVDLAAILKPLRAKRAEMEAQMEQARPMPLGGWLPATDLFDGDADLSAQRATIGRHLDSIVVLPHSGNDKIADPTRLVLRWRDGETQRLDAYSLDGIAVRSTKEGKWTLPTPFSLASMPGLRVYEADGVQMVGPA